MSSDIQTAERLERMIIVLREEANYLRNKTNTQPMTEEEALYSFVNKQLGIPIDLIKNLHESCKKS